MSLTTSITRTSNSDTEDKLTITANIVSAGGLVFQLALQYLVLVEFNNFEFSFINMTADFSYVSSKKLVYNTTGSVTPYIFLNGFSKVVMTECVQIAPPVVGTFNYPISIGGLGACPAQNI